MIRKRTVDLQLFLFRREFIISIKLQWGNLSCRLVFETFRIVEVSRKDGERMVPKTSNSGLLSKSVWVDIILTSFFFSSKIHFLYEMCPEKKLLFTTWSSRMLITESESVYSLSWGMKSLKTRAWNEWNFVVLKNVCSQSSGVSFGAWRDLLEKTRRAAISKCLLDLEGLILWLWGSGKGYTSW